MNLCLQSCRRLLGAVVLLSLAALPAGAQEDGRFVIETITVAGPEGTAANIVEAETLLREGGTYSEAELQQALSRVRRLPFVLDAGYTLRPGSQPGAHELVIEVQRGRAFFYDHEVRLIAYDETLDLGSTVQGDHVSFDLPGTIGGRGFLGRSGLFSAELNSERGVLAGFTKYDLFGRGITAHIDLSRAGCCQEEILPLGIDPALAVWGFDDSTQVSLGLSVPFTARQDLRFSVSERQGKADSRQPVLEEEYRQLFTELRPPGFSVAGGDLTYRRADVKWVYDTTDDPLVPTRGGSLSVGVEAHRFEGDEVRFRFRTPGVVEIFETVYNFEAEQVVAAVSGVRHWAVTPRQTVSLRGRVAAGHAGDGLFPESDYVGGSAGLLHALTLRKVRGAGGFGDVRLESGVEFGAEEVDRLEPQRLEAFTSVVLRNPWGRLRLGLSYVDWSEQVF